MVEVLMMMTTGMCNGLRYTISLRATDRYKLL